MDNSLSDADLQLLKEFRDITNDTEFSNNHLLYLLRLRNYDLNSLINQYFNQKESFIQMM